MEDTLREDVARTYINELEGLNPYSNGRYSESFSWDSLIGDVECLNPYSNGRYSERGLLVLPNRLVT